MGSNEFGNLSDHVSDHTQIHELIHPERPDLTTRPATRKNTYAFFEAATHHETIGIKSNMGLSGDRIVGDGRC
jgi:hypothetical protein